MSEIAEKAGDADAAQTRSGGFSFGGRARALIDKSGKACARVLNQEWFAVLLALALTAFVACYVRFLDFGLYEDDLNQTRFWAYSFSEIRDYVAKLFTSGAGGRPIGLTFLRGGFWAGHHLGGLPTLYLVGFFIFLANAFLTYKITRSIAPASIALLAGLAFVVYPADALKFTIVRGLVVQASLTFGLGAMLLYIQGRRIAAYVLAALAVGVYEFGILPFFVAPFFILEPWRAKLRRVLVHAIIIAGVMGAIILVRLKFAAGHLEELTPLSLGGFLQRFYIALTTGPWVSFKGFFTKPAAFFRDYETWHLLVVAIVLTVSIVGLRGLWRQDEISTGKGGAAIRSWSERADAFFGRPNPYLAIVVGVAAWIIAYSMALSESRFPPAAQWGRVTSVHTAATFGASLTFSGLAWLLIGLMTRAGLNARQVVVPVVSLYIAILAGFHAVVQQKCVESWQLQQHLWRQIVAQTPDWRDGTVLIVDYKQAPHTKYVYTMSWATAVIAENMFEFPKSWKDPPTVVFGPQLTPTAEVRDGELWLRRRPWFEKARVDPKKVIVFRVYPGDVLKRERRVFQFKSWKVRPAPKGPRAKLETKPLYDLLIGDPECADARRGSECLAPAVVKAGT